jgi:hypothetical protein
VYCTYVASKGIVALWVALSNHVRSCLGVVRVM